MTTSNLNEVGLLDVTRHDGGVTSSRLSLDDRLFVIECLRKVLCVYSLFGFSSENFTMKSKQDYWIQQASLCNEPIKFVKYKLAAFFHSVMGFEDDPPAKPDGVVDTDRPDILIGGRAHRWLRYMLLNLDATFRIQFATAILYSKKGMPRPRKSVVNKSRTKTFEKLTTVPIASRSFELISPIDNWADITDGKVEDLLSRPTFKDKFRRTCKAVLNGRQFNVDDFVKPQVPSVSANYSHTRTDAGTIGVILEHPDLLKGLKGKQLRVIQQYTRGGMIPEVITDDLVDAYYTLYHRMLNAGLLEASTVLLVGLPEALKVRVISKGPPLTYAVLKPYQKFYHSVMRQLPQFAFIGEPVSELKLNEVLGREPKIDRGRKFCSIDYDDATNNIFIWASIDCVDALCDELNVSPEIRHLHHKSMTGHLIVDPDNKFIKDFFKRSSIRDVYEIYKYISTNEPENLDKLNLALKMQKRAQLMGSIMSFIILCLINLTVVWWATEVDHDREFRLQDLKCTINGDDAVARWTTRGRDAWRQIASFVGLVPSQGKVYFDAYYLNINSTSFIYYPNGYEGYFQSGENINIFSGAKRMNHYQKIGYPNLGLLFDIKRSGVRGLDSSLSLTIGQRCREFIDNCPPDMRERCMGQFLYREFSKRSEFDRIRGLIRELTPKIRYAKGDELYKLKYKRQLLQKDLSRHFSPVNLGLPMYLPIEFGGLGFPEVGQYRCKKLDIKVANALHDAITRSEIKLPQKPIKTSWKIWSYAMKRFRTLGLDKYKHVIEPEDVRNIRLDQQMGLISNSTVMNLLCVESLFNCSDISEIYEELEESSRKVEYAYYDKVKKILTQVLMDGKNLCYPKQRVYHDVLVMTPDDDPDDNVEGDPIFSATYVTEYFEEDIKDVQYFYDTNLQDSNDRKHILVDLAGLSAANVDS
jgi:hypothetical protein